MKRSPLALTSVVALAVGACPQPPERDPLPPAAPEEVVPAVPTVPRCAGDIASCAWFEEVAVEVGLTPPEPGPGPGAGVAIGDVDGDGLPDLVHGGNDHARLWLQRGAGAFVEATSAWGLRTVAAEVGMVLVDYDGDGDLDLAANSLRDARDLYLLRNDGDRFTDVTEGLGFTSDGLASASAWADYDQDGDLDVYIARYSTTDDNTLWRNESATAFTDVTAEAGVGNPGTLSLQPIWFDADDDGDLDLYVANDKETVPALFRNEGGDAPFADVSLEAGVVIEVEAMGVVAGDFDGDRDLDLYVGNVPHLPIWEVSNLLYFNDGNGLFRERARSRGAAVDRWTWAVWQLDPDLDGDLDLFVAVDVGIDGLGSVLLENVNGLGWFVDATDRAELGYVGNSYSAAGGDLDGDGLPDLVVTNRGLEPALLVYRNRGVGGGHWLKVRLAGTGRNVYGIGARVTLEAGDLTSVRELHAGEGLRGSGPPEIVFGLGARTTVDRLTVRWPTGGVSVLEDLAADSVVLVQ